MVEATENATLRAKLAEAEAILEPFARSADKYDSNWPSYSLMPGITFGDCRRASAFLHSIAELRQKRKP